MAHHPHVYSTEAITLRRTNFGEADRILTLFTPTYGKVRAIAKGVRRTTSRLAGHLEPFTRTQLLLASGRDLDIVTQAEARERLDALRDDVWHATAAWYLAEMVDRFLEDADPHTHLYGLFIAMLRQLNDDARAHDTARSWLALRYFELHLLTDLGVRPNLHHCVNCDRPLRPEENSYSAELGGALCPACRHLGQRRLTLNALKVLRLLQASTWEAVPRLRLDADLQREMEAVLQSTLRFHLDRELKSWSFLQKAPTRL